jgi:hypothetical protein
MNRQYLEESVDVCVKVLSTLREDLR